MKRETLKKIDKLKEKALQPPLPTEKFTRAIEEAKEDFMDGDSLFKVLCALNFLNYAVKLSWYRDKVDYGFIKGRAADVLSRLCNSEFRMSCDVKMYINEKQAAFITLYGLQFSFHGIRYTPEIRAYRESEKNVYQEWEGYPLQMIAEELFDLAQIL